MASAINTHSFHGELKGLESVSKQDRPFVPIVFYSFRIMLYLGFAMLFFSMYGTYLPFQKNHLHQQAVFKTGKMDGPFRLYFSFNWLDHR